MSKLNPLCTTEIIEDCRFICASIGLGTYKNGGDVLTWGLVGITSSVREKGGSTDNLPTLLIIDPHLLSHLWFSSAPLGTSGARTNPIIKYSLLKILQNFRDVSTILRVFGKSLRLRVRSEHQSPFDFLEFAERNSAQARQ
jgi:hypothetical protein